MSTLWVHHTINTNQERGSKMEAVNDTNTIIMSDFDQLVLIVGYERATKLQNMNNLRREMKDDNDNSK